MLSRQFQRISLLLVLGVVICVAGCSDSEPKPKPTPAPAATDALAKPAEQPAPQTNDSAPKPAAQDAAAKKPSGRIVIYSGRSQNLVESLINQFKSQTGIEVDVRYGGTPQLAALIAEEGDRSHADVFWAQDAASLGQMAKEGRFTQLPEGVLNRVDAKFRSGSGQWVATSGRARVLAYSPKRVTAEQLPTSVFDLTDSKWRGRVGWAPTNGSFKAFVTAMRVQHGDEKTLAWLIGMKENEAKVYPKNTPIIAALAAGEIDLGLPNHYYLLRAKAEDPNFPVEQTFFEAGDTGNLLLVAGAGVLNTSQNEAAATAFIEFLLSADAAQKYFTGSNMEYAVIEGVEPRPELANQTQLNAVAPQIDLDEIYDVDGTDALLKKAGL